MLPLADKVYIADFHVSVFAFTTEPDQFFVCFRQISVSGSKCFRNRNRVIMFAETRSYIPETFFFVVISVGANVKLRSANLISFFGVSGCSRCLNCVNRSIHISGNHNLQSDHQGTCQRICVLILRITSRRDFFDHYILVIPNFFLILCRFSDIVYGFLFLLKNCPSQSS